MQTINIKVAQKVPVIFKIFSLNIHNNSGDVNGFIASIHVHIYRDQ